MAQFVKGTLELLAPYFCVQTSDKLQRSDADLEEKDAAEDTNKRVCGAGAAPSCATRWHQLTDCCAAGSRVTLLSCSH